MVIKQKIGNINTTPLIGAIHDFLTLHWYETSNRIINKKTSAGKEITLRFLKENQQLTEGDIIYNEADLSISISILPCKVILIEPRNMKEMAAICYEIGNKHQALFIEGDTLLVPFDQPLFNQLSTMGYELNICEKKLINPLRTSVAPHSDGNSTLLSKILKLTARDDE